QPAKSSLTPQATRPGRLNRMGSLQQQEIFDFSLQAFYPVRAAGKAGQRMTKHPKSTGHETP
ncbi:MAG TPA: hypothetical protein VFG48_04105, partial [Xanthomonadales bacterium]|nr:hypothetical protein [Xanthomonadales bacterium]